MIQKKAQEVKNKFSHTLSSKAGQEEMVGFGMIIIIVSVILMIIIGFALKRNTSEENLEDYEVGSFIQSSLYYTTDCESSLEPLSIQNLIFSCYKNESCIDGRQSCYVLNQTMNEMIKESWAVSKEGIYKSYQFKISVENKSVMTESYGNQTGNSKGSKQFLSKSYGDAEITMKVFS
jgi:hypothetical protein